MFDMQWVKPIHLSRSNPVALNLDLRKGDMYLLVSEASA